MPIIPTIGRRSIKIRLVIALAYILLIAGSVTMIYPFLIMLSGSVKGQADMDRPDPLPQLLYSDRMQFARFEEARYGNLVAVSAAFGKELFKFDQAELPVGVDDKELDEFQRFRREKSSDFPAHFYYAAEMCSEKQVLPRNFRKFLDEIRRECGTIDKFNRRYKMTLRNWNEFPGGLDTPLVKEFMYDSSDLLTARYLEFKRRLPLEDKAFVNIDGCYFNVQKSYPEVKNGSIDPNPVLAATCPSGKEKAVWAEFVKHNLNCLFINLDPKGLMLFRQYLAAKFPGGIEAMNRTNDTRYRSFEEVNASYKELMNSAFFILYTDFITNICPAERLRVDTPSTRYREYVGFQTAAVPFVAYDYSVFKQRKSPFMVEMLTRNYVSVIEFIAVYGRAIFNTIIYIGLSILAALLVNPLAAYALSRFNLKSTYSILMFFMITMAFPGVVTMIPNFLLLKQLNLLNTFWALVLPGAASGYSVFILKGFFDSIPKEVYESAMIDGAGEWTMFWRFTMALSKPILALITLSAFTGAYTAFMFAMIICPDEKMWTLMVWLYQIQHEALQPIVYAALILAAIPTLLVFVLAQNTILKGIVIPMEK